MNKGFDQVAAFQKLWTDSFANMASVWSQFSPGSPPSDEMRKMRGGMLKVLAETWDEYMRTPQFMEMMKASLNGALDLKRMARDGMNRVHEQFETPSKEDIDGVLLAIRHVEGRLLDRLEGLDDRVVEPGRKNRQGRSADRKAGECHRTAGTDFKDQGTETGGHHQAPNIHPVNEHYYYFS